MTQNSAQVYITRLAQSGLVTRRPLEGSPAVALTAVAHRLLQRIEERVREFGQESAADGNYTFIWYALPKSKRAERSRLVQELRTQGFGSLQDSTWLAMHDRQVTMMAVIDELGLTGECSLLVGRQSAMSNPALLIERGWDLGALRPAYDDFIREYRDYAAPAAISDRDAFVVRVQMLEAFKSFFGIDPEYGDVEVGERRREATSLFWTAYRALGPSAEAHFASVVLDD
ncbi:PaaX family transcriptional regulator C-terminal domain-containing protein [Microbacterium sp. SSM24]|uniref:PaaX family transcriptional regulator C-terminal domain-containing protein n=1 Tax=Microbacterium sp. SSM24 TaxID=2991714 RepID=UPI002227A85E|nr:PaaX family transcriptional regulator C-terminal domain-containing protein [Microbacterium sp. SSM24]MCW3492615.1 hypothetical protein [Microbacterium sp. SSM24]